MATITIKAKLVDNHAGTVTIEVPSLSIGHLDLGGKGEIVNHETGERRELNDQEVYDLEACLDNFIKLQLGRALAAVIKV